MALRAIRYTGAGHKGMEDNPGVVHIAGASLRFLDVETLCGYAWTYMPQEDTTDPVTCHGCIGVYREIKKDRKIKLQGGR